MKSLARSTGIDAFALFLLSQTLEGVKISGGLPTFIFGGLALTLLTMILKPVLQIIALPLNLVTFGTFSFLINIIILYLLTVFVSQVSITPFVFKGASLYGFIIPQIGFNNFFAFGISAFVLSLIISFVEWLIK